MRRLTQLLNLRVRLAAGAASDTTRRSLATGSELVSRLGAWGSVSDPAGVDAPHYVSADTAPWRFSLQRNAAVAPAALALFAIGCAIAALLQAPLLRLYSSVVAVLARVPRGELVGNGTSVSFRPMFLLLILLLGAFALGSAAQRLKLLVYGTAGYIVAVLAVDVVFARAHGWLGTPFSDAGGIVAGIVGVLVVVVTIFSRYELPTGVRVETMRRRPRLPLLVLGAAVLVGIALVLLASLALRRSVGEVHVRFVGGLDSEVVLTIVTIFFVLAMVSRLERARKPQEDPDLTFAFIIPVQNESEGIGECLASINRAAGYHERRCSVYVVDNGSSDDTAAVAERALARCANLDGRVLSCPGRGKAVALNYGLKHIDEDIIVRVDGDTIVETSLLAQIVPWFADPAVGGVSGLPLPKKTSARWLYPLRLIEVYYGIVFLRVAQGAADAVLVMPGLIAAYRRVLVHELGGFGEGFNGEDADMSMRIGRLGYRIVTDPEIRVYTEVPATLGQFREQRQRWARGLFHMANRNLSSVRMTQGARAVWNLPWSIFNASRRSLTVPILLGALTVKLVAPSMLSLREIAIVTGFLVGLQLIVIALILVAHREFAALPFVPLYLLFRLLRAYIAFETILTLRLKGVGSATIAAPVLPTVGAAAITGRRSGVPVG